MKVFEGGYNFPEGYTVGREDWHFAKQLFLRYKIVLQYGEISALRKRIKSQRKKKLGRSLRGGRTGHTLNWVRREPNGTIGTYPIKVVAPDAQALVTALPSDKPRKWEVF